MSKIYIPLKLRVNVQYEKELHVDCLRAAETAMLACLAPENTLHVCKPNAVVRKIFFKTIMIPVYK